MIVKIQRPLEPQGPDRPREYNADADIAMVYNESRSYIAHVFMKNVSYLFTDGRLKVYVKARTAKSGGVPTVDMDKWVNLRVSLQDGIATEDTLANGHLVIDKLVKDQPW